MTAQLSRLQAATQASQDVVSYAQTADGFLSTIEQQLSRMSELAQSATNGAFGSSDISNYNTEFSDIVNQISSIFSNADFDGRLYLLPARMPLQASRSRLMPRATPTR